MNDLRKFGYTRAEDCSILGQIELKTLMAAMSSWLSDLNFAAPVHFAAEL